MSTTLLIVMIVTAVFTFLGGMFALRFKDKSHLIIGFSAGAVIGVAFFDLLPESIMLGGSAVVTLITIGFLAYMVLDRSIGIHTHQLSHDHDHERVHNESKTRGSLRALVLSIHSLLDGVAIGLSFQVSAALGAVVTAAVIAHDFSDGINTVSAIMKAGEESRTAMRWLLVDALAPVAGIVSTIFFTLSDASFGPLLALFCGFFLYIGASDLIPESYHAHPTRWTTISTILGAGVIYFVIRLVG